MQVRNLFVPQHAARAVQALKSRKWSQIEFLELLESVHSHGSVASLPAISLEALFSHLPSVVSPLIRHRCLNILGPVPEEFRAYVNLSHLASQDIEQAYAGALASPTMGPEGPKMAVLSQLIGYGALKLHPCSASTWAQLFEASLDAEDLATAGALWQRRPAHLVIAEPEMLRFADLVGRHRNKALLKEIWLKSSGELPLTSSGIASSLACFSQDNQELVRHIEAHKALIDAHLTIQDARHVSDALAPHVLDICETKSGISTALGNLLLQGLYRNNASQTVLHFYRYLVRHQRFRPNEDTAQILVNSAYRLGNSKLLCFEIWRELSQDWQLELDRKFFETMVVCQMVGSNYTSVLYFVAEMARRHITVRKHIQRLIYNKFERLGNTTPLLDMTFPGIKSKFLDFDYETAVAESVPAGQAKNNAQLFLQGKSPESDPLVVLKSMLDFDKHKASFHTADRP